MKWQSKKNEDEELVDESEYENVRTVGNCIYFYTDVSMESILELTAQLKKLSNELQRKVIDTPGYQPYIDIHINSGGGDVFAGLAGMDTIYNTDIWVNTIVDGMCASAATFLLLGGHYRYMNEHAYILIHQLSGSCWGKYEELKDEMINTKKLMKTLKSMYTKYTSIPTKKLEDEFMKRDIYLSTTKCLKYHIVDDIVAWS